MSPLPLVQLKEYFERRLERARQTSAGQPDQVDATFGGLVREVLWLTERTLGEMFGRYHYELSVFIDRAHPRIVAYYDSDNNHRSRSADKRDENPNYYRDKKYEVVELLDEPMGGVRIVSDTHQDSYESSPDQLNRIGSTILYCFDVERPAALVATCSERTRFAEDDMSLIELIRTVAIMIRTDLELRSRLPLKGRSPALGRRTFSWLHVSDLHFGAGPQSHRFDQSAVCRAMIKDVEQHAPRPDAIFVTGDIAFRGGADEYAQAAEWLAKLIQAAGVSHDRVFLVPGNHDVDRGNADGATANPYHTQYRADPARLEDGLHTPTVRKILMEKIEAFERFLATHFPSHPQGSAGTYVDWNKSESIDHDGRKLRLRLVGLSTVWVSDSLDGRRTKNGDFVPNMALGRQQLETTIASADDEEILFILTHHPPEWLLETCRENLRTYLASRRCIHLCGHIHRKQVALHQELGNATATIRYIAGAAHDEDLPGNSEHSYAWGALRWHDDGWQIGWAPRVYVRALGRMRADRNHYDLEDDGFAWQRAPWQ